LSAEAQMTVPQALRAMADKIESGVWDGGAAACVVEVRGTAHVCTFDGGDGSRGVALLAIVGAEIASGTVGRVEH